MSEKADMTPERAVEPKAKPEPKPEPKAKSKPVLDKSQPFATVFGSSTPARYYQDGAYFTGQGEYHGDQP